MIAQLVYAIISEERVKTLSVCKALETAQEIARAIYGPEAYAIEVTYIPCQEGDICIGNRFYREDESGNRVEIEAVPTEKEDIETLKTQNQSLTLALAETIGGMTDVE